MCPFSLLARFWIIVFVLFCLCQYTLSQIESKWNITCDPDSPQIFIDETISVHCNVTGKLTFRFK